MSALQIRRMASQLLAAGASTDLIAQAVCEAHRGNEAARKQESGREAIRAMQRLTERKRGGWN